MGTILYCLDYKIPLGNLHVFFRRRLSFFSGQFCDARNSFLAYSMYGPESKLNQFCSIVHVVICRRKVVNLVTPREPLVVLANCKIGWPIYLAYYILLGDNDVMKRYAMEHFLFPGNIDFAADDQGAL